MLLSCAITQLTFVSTSIWPIAGTIMLNSFAREQRQKKKSDLKSNLAEEDCERKEVQVTGEDWKSRGDSGAGSVITT